MESHFEPTKYKYTYPRFVRGMETDRIILVYDKYYGIVLWTRRNESNDLAVPYAIQDNFESDKYENAAGTLTIELP